LILVPAIHAETVPRKRFSWGRFRASSPKIGRRTERNGHPSKTDEGAFRTASRINGRYFSKIASLVTKPLFLSQAKNLTRQAYSRRISRKTKGEVPGF
jgi:hypothetical protein